MNYLSTIDNFNCKDGNYKRHMLVSGVDKWVHTKVFEHYVSDAKNNNIIIIDFGTEMWDGLCNHPIPDYTLINLFETQNFFPNPLVDVKTFIGKANIKILGECLGFTEDQKNKLVNYMCLIKELLEIEKADDFSNGILLKELKQFSTNSKVQAKLEEFRYAGRLSNELYEDVIHRYSEVSAVGADFSAAFLILEAFFSDDTKVHIESLADKTIIYVPMGLLNQDEKLQGTILSLLLYSLKVSKKQDNFFIMLNDLGQGTTSGIYKFLLNIPLRVEKLCFTEDVFSLCENNNLSNFLNKFETQIFTRHQMLSCDKLEKLGGEVKTIYHTNTVTHDYRIGANSMLDILLQRDKIEAHAEHIPVWEPRFRKEDIAELGVGTCLVWRNGNMTMCNI